MKDSSPPSSVESELLFAFLDRTLGTEEFADYPGAWNGVQVAGPHRIGKVAVAVDASLRTIQGAMETEADLLLVHHGLFWDPDPRVVGHRFQRLSLLLEHRIAVYASHLPLDAHPEVGNSVILARKLGIDVKGRFGEAKGVGIGWWGELAGSREALCERVEELVEGPVQLIPGGPEKVGRVGVVTGGGGSFVKAALESGLSTLVTGEGPHHTYAEAMDGGLNLLYAGHYATETWGVRALGELLQREFGLPWVFLPDPSGL